MARSFRKEIKEPDSFHVYAEKITLWYQANTKPVLALAAVLLVSLGAFFGYRAWKNHIKEQSGIALAIAQTEDALRKAADNYPGTKAGAIARLRLAMLLRTRGAHKESEKEYHRLLNAGGIAEMDRELAKRGLAGTLSLQGKCAEAILIWKKIIYSGSLLTPEDLYISVGSCLEETGKRADALKTYEELIQKYPRSPFITAQLRARMNVLGK